jgi:hypothetical protein
MAQHIIKQGEHVSRVADEHGFHSYRALWDHGENQALKQLRRNPNVLFPGDTLFVPERQEGLEAGATEQRHRFQLHATPLILRLVLRTIDGEPIRNTACELLLNLQRIPLVTNNDGMIEHEIPKRGEEVKVFVPTRELEFDLKIGHLDPIEEVSGEQARLDNLGYFAGYSPQDTKQLLWAVEEFQCEHDLPVTGVYDAATKAKLEKDYGC